MRGREKEKARGRESERKKEGERMEMRVNYFHHAKRITAGTAEENY